MKSEFLFQQQKYVHSVRSGKTVTKKIVQHITKAKLFLKKESRSLSTVYTIDYGQELRKWHLWNSHQDFPDNFISEAKAIIEHGFENVAIKSSSVSESNVRSNECFTCVAYSTDPNDTVIKDCYSGQGRVNETVWCILYHNYGPNDMVLIPLEIIDFWPPIGNGEWKTCDGGQVCLTYFYFNNMVPYGIDMTYQAMTSCRKYWLAYSFALLFKICCIWCARLCIFNIL